MSYSYYTDEKVKDNSETSFYSKTNAPQHISKRTHTKYGCMPLLDLKVKDIWNPRLDKIIPFLPKNAWIAGGFLRSMIEGSDDSSGDIDFFFHTEDSFNNLLELIKRPSAEASKGFGYYSIPNYDKINKLRIVDCESAVNFRPNIQLVRLFWFDSPEHVIDSFDFTACQFITDGRTLWFGPKSFDDVTERKLRWHRDISVIDPISALNRILKYQEKGYKISKDAFEAAENAAYKVLTNTEEMSKILAQEKTEIGIHKHAISHLQRAWDYLSTAPLTRSAYAKARFSPFKKKESKTRVSFNYDAS